MSTSTQERDDLLIRNLWKARKEEEIPPSLPGLSPSLLSLCDLM